MKLEPGKFCPLIKKDCLGLQCCWFTQVRGTNPQTGGEVDEWACAIAWLPMLTINIAQQVRQGAASTDSCRNDVLGALGNVLRQHPALANSQDKPHAVTLDKTRKQ